MYQKKKARLKRALRSRMKIKELNCFRLSVNRSSKHIYAQLISVTGDKVLASASTLDKVLRDQPTCNIDAAKRVGQLIGERAKSIGIEKIAFDRSGFRYHGRVKALAEAARESGLKF
ncbi:MAG: 50S ribosomal protein L18 [Endozoicomonadaceae bacterium]|nr:50S ribosomal protein L18 [Endozoicomonadaceae bacterium]